MIATCCYFAIWLSWESTAHLHQNLLSFPLCCCCFGEHYCHSTVLRYAYEQISELLELNPVG